MGTLPSDTVIANRYQVLRPLGRGWGLCSDPVNSLDNLIQTLDLPSRRKTR